MQSSGIFAGMTYRNPMGHRIKVFEVQPFGMLWVGFPDGTRQWAKHKRALVAEFKAGESIVCAQPSAEQSNGQ